MRETDRLGLTNGPPVVFSLESRRINGHTDEECE